MLAAPPKGLDPKVLFQPVEGCHQIALAVSGGSDSMALLRLAAAWSERPQVTVLTVDHGLRADSAGEAAQVAKWAAALGLAHVTLRWQGAKPATGLQARARDARYALMSRWCLENGAAWLLTAHTMDDQAETVVMRMARTTSLDSLAGIPALGQWRGLGLFRPLLDLRRDNLRAMLRDMAQPWIDDPSNDDDRFERVRIRKALPLLAGIGLSVESLSRLAAEARAASEGLRAAAQDWVTAHGEAFEEGYCTVPLSAFAVEADALKPRILGVLIGRFGSGAQADPGELAALANWIVQGGTRRTLGGAIIARRRDHLVIGREPGRIDPVPVEVPGTGHMVWDNRFAVTAPPGSLVRPVLKALPIPRNRNLPAVVQHSLPAITLPEGSLCVPHLGLGSGALARFCAGSAG